MSKRPSKARSQRDHFKRRVQQRYGVTIDKRLYRDIIERIQRGEAVPIEKQSLRLTVFGVTIEAEGEVVDMRVVYDRDRKTLVTVLPKE